MAKRKSGSSSKLQQVEQKQAKQQKEIKQYKKSQQFTKWVAVAILALVLLGMLGAGYATDWTRGLRKASNSEGLNSTNPIGADTNETATVDGSSGKSREVTTSTTNNSTTTSTTNNSSGGGSGTDNTSLFEELTKLYNDTGVGGNVNDLIDRAKSVGIDIDCNSDILTRDCTFSVDGQNFSIRSLLGTGTITGILNGL